MAGVRRVTFFAALKRFFFEGSARNPRSVTSTSSRGSQERFGKDGYKERSDRNNGKLCILAHLEFFILVVFGAVVHVRGRVERIEDLVWYAAFGVRDIAVLLGSILRSSDRGHGESWKR